MKAIRWLFQQPADFDFWYYPKPVEFYRKKCCKMINSPTSLPYRIAFQILKNPEESSDIVWDEAIAEEMIHLTVLSIGKKCKPWPLGLIATTKITKPLIADELQLAEQAVDDAFSTKNMRELARGCRNWFRVCSVMQQGVKF